MIYYKELDLPVIPEDLLKFNFLPMTGPIDVGYGNSHIKNSKQLSPCNYKFSTSVDSRLIKWVKENIKGIKPFEFFLQVIEHETGGVHIVHSDIKRTYALNYMIETGGDNAWTSWYRENNMPIRRSKTRINTQSDTGYVGYENLELLETVKFKKNKWYLISTDILHDVDEVVGVRSSLSISINADRENEIFKELGISNE
jgi:hypothetical protein